MVAKRSRSKSRKRPAKRVIVTGDKALEDKLNSMGAATAKKLARTATREVAKGVADLARAYVPVDTGELEDSIKVRALDRSQGRIGKVGARVITGDEKSLFRGDTFYGGFQEYGTQTMPANSFMIPAMEQSEGTAMRQFAAALREQIKKEEVRQAKKMAKAKP